jgi:hypothetical protein
VLPAHFLRVRRVIRRSFHVDRFFFVGFIRFVARPLGHFIRWVILSWESFVGSFFVGSARGSHSLDYCFVAVVRVSLDCGRLCPLCFMWVVC